MELTSQGHLSYKSSSLASRIRTPARRTLFKIQSFLFVIQLVIIFQQPKCIQSVETDIVNTRAIQASQPGVSYCRMSETAHFDPLIICEHEKDPSVISDHLTQCVPEGLRVSRKSKSMASPSIETGAIPTQDSQKFKPMFPDMSRVNEVEPTLLHSPRRPKSRTESHLSGEQWSFTFESDSREVNRKRKRIPYLNKLDVHHQYSQSEPHRKNIRALLGAQHKISARHVSQGSRELPPHDPIMGKNAMRAFTSQSRQVNDFVPSGWPVIQSIERTSTQAELVELDLLSKLSRSENVGRTWKEAGLTENATERLIGEKGRTQQTSISSAPALLGKFLRSPSTPPSSTQAVKTVLPNSKEICDSVVAERSMERTRDQAHNIQPEFMDERRRYLSHHSSNLCFPRLVLNDESKTIKLLETDTSMPVKSKHHDKINTIHHNNDMSTAFKSYIESHHNLPNGFYETYAYPVRNTRGFQPFEATKDIFDESFFDVKLANKLQESDQIQGLRVSYKTDSNSNGERAYPPEEVEDILKLLQWNQNKKYYLGKEVLIDKGPGLMEPMIEFLKAKYLNAFFQSQPKGVIWTNENEENISMLLNGYQHASILYKRDFSTAHGRDQHTAVHLFYLANEEVDAMGLDSAIDKMISKLKDNLYNNLLSKKIELRGYYGSRFKPFVKKCMVQVKNATKGVIFMARLLNSLIRDSEKVSTGIRAQQNEVFEFLKLFWEDFKLFQPEAVQNYSWIKDFDPSVEANLKKILGCLEKTRKEIIDKRVVWKILAMWVKEYRKTIFPKICYEYTKFHHNWTGFMNWLIVLSIPQTVSKK